MIEKTVSIVISSIALKAPAELSMRIVSPSFAVEGRDICDAPGQKSGNFTHSAPSVKSSASPPNKPVQIARAVQAFWSPLIRRSDRTYADSR